MNNYMFRYTQDTILRINRLENIQAEILNQEIGTMYIKEKFGEDQQQGQPALYG